MTEIAYEKGNYFLLTLEHLIGRPRLDTFIEEYFARHSFQAMDTTRFITYLRQELLNKEPGLEEQLQLAAWIDGPGLPAGAPPIAAARFAAVAEAQQHWLAGTAASSLDTAQWSSHEWVHFLQCLPHPLTNAQLTELDAAFGFTTSGNAEILTAWLPLTLAAGYLPAEEALHHFLVRVGRRKFLVPLYRALLATPDGRARAQRIYAEARPNYHAVATNTLDALVGQP